MPSQDLTNTVKRKLLSSSPIYIVFVIHLIFLLIAACYIVYNYTEPHVEFPIMPNPLSR
jgi:hypothetical protein